MTDKSNLKDIEEAIVAFTHNIAHPGYENRCNNSQDDKTALHILKQIRGGKLVERATDQNILCRDCEYRVGKVVSPATEHELEVLRKNYASQVKYTTTLEDKIRKLEASPVITADLEKLRPALEKLLCKATDDLGYVYSGDGKKDITDTLADCRAAMIKEDEDEARYKTQMPQVRNIKPR